MSLIEEGPEKKVRMAHLAVVGIARVNGVAALHTELLKRDVLRDFAEMCPERFNNKTNGVTPRRWLLAVQPAARRRSSPSAIGDGWITDLDAAARARAARRRRGVPRSAFARGEAREQGRARGATSRDTTVASASTRTSLFDVQIKRLHEYKRQLLNALHIVAL